MEKCSPIELRKNLLVVKQLSNLGLDFVSIPVKNLEHKLELTNQLNSALEEITAEIELKEKS